MIQQREFECKQCKRKGCKHLCLLPSWIYCSDECGRLSFNSRQLITRHKRENKSE